LRARCFKQVTALTRNLSPKHSPDVLYREVRRYFPHNDAVALLMAAATVNTLD
jgi:hypothetical protein